MPPNLWPPDGPDGLAGLPKFDEPNPLKLRVMF